MPAIGAPVRVALLGYGLAGRIFHAPLLGAVPGFELRTVVTSDPERATQAARDLPGVQVQARAGSIWAHPGDHDLVVVATTTATHVSLAAAAVDAGLSVVVEKPLAPSAAEARQLVAHAASRGVMLVPFHNRRWDADHLTLRRLVADGELGTVARYESRFERWRPVADPAAWRHSTPAAEGGGVLLDLGPHLVDQAVQLFGDVAAVYGEVTARRGGADDDAFLALEHRSGVRSHLWASAVAAAPGPRLRVLGSRAAFVVPGLDGQESALRAGRRPGEPGFGDEPADRWGRLHGVAADPAAGRPVPSEPGRWTDFYRLVRAALAGDGPPPVDAADAVAVAAILDAARRSSVSGTVEVPAVG